MHFKRESYLPGMANYVARDWIIAEQAIVVRVAAVPLIPQHWADSVYA